MAKSLAELRQSRSAGLPERSMTVCLSQAIVSQVQALVDEQNALDTQAAVEAAQRDPDQPTRLPPPRVGEIKAELEVLYAEMREHEGEIILRGIPSGEWRRWVQEHPARMKGDDGRDTAESQLDQRVAFGFCNGNALVADLERYVKSYNGETLVEGDWEFIANRVAGGDLREMAQKVIEMQEGVGARAPKASPTLSSPSQPTGTV